jgi:hypothetical protein
MQEAKQLGVADQELTEVHRETTVHEDRDRDGRPMP